MKWIGAVSFYQMKVISSCRDLIPSLYVAHQKRSFEKALCSIRKASRQKDALRMLFCKCPWSNFAYRGYDEQQKLVANNKKKNLQRIIVANLHPQAIFQQDSTPCHKAKIITNCFKKMKIEVLEWLGNSPSFSSIENLWSIVKNCLRKQDCITKMKVI